MPPTLEALSRSGTPAAGASVQAGVMRRSPVVLGIVAGLLAGAGAAAAVAVAGHGEEKPKLVISGTPAPAASQSALPKGAPAGGVAIVVKGPLPSLEGEARAYRLGAE